MRVQLAKLIVNSGGAAALVDYVADAQASGQTDRKSLDLSSNLSSTGRASCLLVFQHAEK